MQQLGTTRILILAALLVGLAAGCSVDPMERLSEDIKSQDVEKRRAAVLTLANLDDDRAVDALIDVLEGDDELCDMAGVALVKKGREVEEPDPKKPNPVIDLVAKVLTNAHLAESFRARAAWVIGEIGDRRGIPPLQAGQTALTGLKPATLVRDISKQSLEKLGFFSVGRQFDIPMGGLEGPSELLPDAAPLAPA
jgi:hypothetical protein